MFTNLWITFFLILPVNNFVNNSLQLCGYFNIISCEILSSG